MSIDSGTWGALVENAPKIISEAAQSALGILALVILVLAVLAVIFFKRDDAKIRIGVFGALFLAFIGLSLVAVYEEAATQARADQSQLDPTEAAELQVYLTRCSDGVAEACNSAAVRIGDGKGHPVDFEKSAALYEKACELGSGRGCRNYARRLKLGKGVPVDLERARSFYERACKLNYAKACDELKAL